MLVRTAHAFALNHHASIVSAMQHKRSCNSDVRHATACTVIPDVSYRKAHNRSVACRTAVCCEQCKQYAYVCNWQQVEWRACALPHQHPANRVTQQQILFKRLSCNRSCSCLSTDNSAYASRQTADLSLCQSNITINEWPSIREMGSASRNCHITAQ
jgi:hypothetical protein